MNRPTRSPLSASLVRTQRRGLAAALTLLWGPQDTGRPWGAGAGLPPGRGRESGLALSVCKSLRVAAGQWQLRDDRYLVQMETSSLLQGWVRAAAI